MRTRFIEATQDVEGGPNHGKFAVGLFDAEEWGRASELERALAVEASTRAPLLGRCGWTGEHALVLDLQTGEGAVFLPGGSARADLDKHRVWVCPMFEPFLEWLYGRVREQGWEPTGHWFDELPALVELPAAPPSMQGYRREGPA